MNTPTDDADQRWIQMSQDAEPDRLGKALAELVDDGAITTAQAMTIDQALRRAGLTGQTAAASTDGQHGAGTVTAAEVLSYVGAAVTVGALSLVIGLSWDELAQRGQLAVCAAITAIFLIIAVVVSRWRNSLYARRRRLIASVLAALATVAAAVTTAQIADSIHRLDSPWTVVSVGGTTVVIGTASLLAWRQSPSAVVVFIGGLIVLAGTVELVQREGLGSDIYPWLAFFAYAALWIGGGLLLGHPDLPAALGGITALVSAEALALQQPWLKPSLGLILGLLAVTGMFVLFGLRRHWWYAAIGVLGALVVPASAVGQLSSGTLAAGALLLIGLVLVVAALLLNRRRAGTSTPLPHKPSSTDRTE